MINTFALTQTLLVTFCSLTGVIALAHQPLLQVSTEEHIDQERETGGGGPGSPAMVQYERLIEEYKEFRKDFQDAQDQLKTDAERRARFRKHWPLENAFTPRFLLLARSNANDPVAFDALAWIVAFGFSSAESGAAAAILVRDHVQNQRLWPLCQEMSRSPISSARGMLLRALLEHSTDRTIRGRAGFALASFLHEEANFARLLNARLHPWQAQYLTPEILDQFRSLDSRK